jgi:drug/metabolite transporter (DMT)-like permease
LSSVFNAATPLVTPAVTFIVLRQEAVRLSQVVALLVGTPGVVVVLAPWQFSTGSGVDLWGQLASLGATLSLGGVFAYTGKFVSPVGGDQQVSQSSTC